MIDLADPRAHGWRQGVLLPTDFSDLQLKTLNLQKPVSAEDLLIIVSQDCDLVHPSFEEEPFFEILVARRIDEAQKDANKFHGKHPRRLQFDYQRSGIITSYEAWIPEKLNLDRRLLTRALTEYVSLDPALLSVLRIWLGKRYNRPAFPSAFNDRVVPAQAKLTERLKKKGHLITAVLIDIDTMRELTADHPYTISLYLLMRNVDYEKEECRRDALAVLAAAKEAFLKCKGIELENAQITTEEDLKVSDMRRLKSWDYANYLSRRPGHVSEPPT